MPTNPADSPILGTLYGSDAMRAVFDDAATSSACSMSKPRGPRAGAARHHPARGRRAITRAARLENLSTEDSPQARATSASPVVGWSPGVACRRRGRRLDALGRHDAGHHGHRDGPTGARRPGAGARRTRWHVTALADQADRHRQHRDGGAHHLQQALPTTLGLKCAVGHSR